MLSLSQHEDRALSDDQSILGHETDESREQREMQSPYSQDSYGQGQGQGQGYGSPGQGYGNPAGAYNAETNQYAPPPGQAYNTPHNAPYSPQSTATYSPRDYNPQDYAEHPAEGYVPPLTSPAPGRARQGIAGEPYHQEPGVYDYAPEEYGTRQRDRERADQVSPSDAIPHDGERLSSLPTSTLSTQDIARRRQRNA